MKKIIRLTEGDLHNIVKRSVNKILREYGSDGPDFDDAYDENFDIDFENEFSPQRFGHVDSINDDDFESNDDFLNFGSDKPFYDDEDDIDLPNLRHESRRSNGRRQRALTEGLKTTNNANAVPEELARNCGFKLEYGGGEDGYEIWGRDIEPGSYGEELLRTLGIRKWDSWNVNGHVRITVKPEYDYSSEKWNAPRRKIGDYVDTEWADNGGRIFHNPKNGHFKREKF